MLNYFTLLHGVWWYHCIHTLLYLQNNVQISTIDEKMNSFHIEMRFLTATQTWLCMPIYLMMNDDDIIVSKCNTRSRIRKHKSTEANYILFRCWQGYETYHCGHVCRWSFVNWYCFLHKRISVILLRHLLQKKLVMFSILVMCRSKKVDQTMWKCDKSSLQIIRTTVYCRFEANQNSVWFVCKSFTTPTF